ncbi:hypothetical protein BS50DRAFT_569427 [Corynespora cassiicola Philippines]|uniref:NACHT domain-containing protein n=1 Tax=Corynespora cassiicola Philippines TaxID=1448308 RepID=A0A2T2P2A7_CORCC|nr:hypothetical protein BS50DRAFT_569427 [Corynespora cassiicola Philippines]
MLDPISAVGVAAASVQFLDFASRLLATSREVYDSTHGATDELLRLDEVYSHLKKISVQLSQSVVQSPSGPQEEQDVCRLAESCQHECDILIAVIEKLVRKKNSKNAFKSFRQALKIMWSQKAINSLEARLEKYQRELNLALVYNLSNGQSSMARGLCSLVTESRRLEISQRSQNKKILELLEDMRLQYASVTSSSPSNHSGIGLGMIATKMTEALTIATDMIISQRFLQSLYFTSLKARESRIENAHEQTFKWLFQESSKKQRQRHIPSQRFVNWLRSSDGIFWISGKPGSGKSTLMKWITGNAKTEEILFEWANPTWAEEQLQRKRKDADTQKLSSFDEMKDETRGDTELTQPTHSSSFEIQSQLVQDDLEEPIKVVMASFYFWSAGTAMQKSQQGLFQSLLYEIFSHAPTLMQKACPTRWRAAELGEPQQPWTMKEISDAIQRTISLTENSAKFCFFIDGVDEYSGDHSEMVRLLENFSRLPNVKLCVASRPWNVFEDAFGQSPKRKFYLQDLTRQDIKHYVRSKLSKHPAWQGLSHRDEEYKEIATEILERAQGVFLWVFLVVRSLLEGLTNGDTVSLLQERLRRIPTDLREFFKYMLDSLDPIYNSHVALFFLAAMDAPEPLPLAMFSFFEEEFDKTNYVHQMNMSALELYDIIPLQKQTERRLNGRCKGLLEVYRTADGLDFFRYRVGFLHRTVKDFFMTEEMRREFEASLSEKLQVCVSMIKASIAMMKKMPRIGKQLGRDIPFRSLVDMALYNSRKFELLNGAPTTRLLDELSYVLDHLEFFEGYWNSPAGDHNEQFLGLTVERGLMLYASQQLRYPNSGPIATKELQLTAKKRPILDCAIRYFDIPLHGEMDVSDMVWFLLSNGCDPNETVVTSAGFRTPFSNFLEHVGSENSIDNASVSAGIQANRIRSLKHFLTNGANPNHSIAGSLPLWSLFLARICERNEDDAPYPFYLEIIELLFFYGANPNLLDGSDCSCCLIFTPWTHFLIWLAKTDAIRGIKTQSIQRQEFLARICAIMLEHNANKNVHLVTRDRRQYGTPGSVVCNAFRPGLAGSILTALSLPQASDRTINTSDKGKETSAEIPLHQKTCEQTTTVTPSWSPFSWWAYFWRPRAA